MPEPIGSLVDRALDAYGALAELCEELEDEWTYVNELAEAWREPMERVAEEHSAELAPDEVSAAVDRAIEEVARIRDPHRAIDWLSTFPQVVLLAMEPIP